MALEKLIQRIESDAESEANGIIEGARKEAEEIIREAKKKAQKEAAEAEARGEKEAFRLKEKMLASARRRAREMEMRAKEEVIQECMDRAKEELGKLKGKRYEAAVKRFLENGRKSLGDCVVVPSREQDRKIAEKMGIKVEGNAESIGGVIIRSKDRIREIDDTFESIMERKMDELRILIANELFERGE